MSASPQPLPPPSGLSCVQDCAPGYSEGGMSAQLPVTKDALQQPDAQQIGIVLSGVKLICDYLLAAEANHLCGLELDAQLSVRANVCTNIVVNWRKCSLRTTAGVINLRLPELRFLHPRPSMPKRFRRLQSMLFATARSTYEDGVSRTAVETLVKTMWTFSLSDDLLARLTRELCQLLENWRKTPALAIRFVVITTRHIGRVRTQVASAESALVAQPPPKVRKSEDAWASEIDCGFI